MTIESLLKFHKHTNLTASKANCVLGLIRKTFQCRERDMVTKLFKSLIRPIFEYGNLYQLWGTFYSTDQQAIEGVQRHVTKLITSIGHLSYPERLQSNLKLTILVLPAIKRRHDFDLPNQSSQFRRILILALFQPASTTCTRGHSFKYFKPRCKTRCRYNFFSYMTIDNWNNLPSHIVNTDSINSFNR